MRNHKEVGDEAELGLSVCENLANIRKRMNLTQTEVARRLGASRTHLSHLERGGASQVPLSTLVAWGRILGVELGIQFAPKEN